MSNGASKGVDIIIPVYNALEDLMKCVDSVIKHTDLSMHRLILINDKSTDENVHIYMKSLEDAGICVYENETNLGFSGTVNRGIALSENKDVVLLNSDTIVTPSWLDKLIECVYMDEGIATGTPLSNNASICSVPYSNQNNIIPDNMTLDEYADEIERVSIRKYPTIPMAVGFCMFIKRSVINEVGLFDSAAFGLGYGEENDFCNRAAELGYRHVMCDTTFVFHKGTASFEEGSKDNLGGLHESILEERYPQLNRELERYWAYSQNTIVHTNVELYSKLSLGSDKKNILYLIQADFQEGCSNNIGGTQLHVKDLVYGLKDEYNIFVAARDGEFLRVTAYIENKVVPLKFHIGPVSAFYVYRNGNMAALYEHILRAFKIDLVHIHHTMGLTLELHYVAKRLNIPVYLSLHDYYYICPTLRMLDTDKSSCIGQIDWDRCRLCMERKYGIYDGVDYMQKWRGEHAKVISLCEKIILPSRSAADIFEKYYSDIEKKIEIIGHGIDDNIFNKIEKKKELNHEQLHIAFVGGICETKGSEVIYKMITKCHDKFKWYIFGGIDGIELLDLKQKNLTKTGWYKREELKFLLEKHEIDIVCILSTVAETYCYTLSEVVACGVPVIVTDIGALGERMQVMKCGWIVQEKADENMLIELLERIQNDCKSLAERKAILDSWHINTVEDMVSNYRKHYQLIKKKETEKGAIVDFGQILDGYSLNGGAATLNAATTEKMVALERELQVIYSSELYKVMRKLAGILDRVKSIRNKKLE